MKNIFVIIDYDDVFTLTTYENKEKNNKYFIISLI